VTGNLFIINYFGYIFHDADFSLQLRALLQERPMSIERKYFLGEGGQVVHLHFFGFKSTISRLGERFRGGQ